MRSPRRVRGSRKNPISSQRTLDAKFRVFHILEPTSDDLAFVCNRNQGKTELLTKGDSAQALEFIRRGSSWVGYENPLYK